MRSSTELDLASEAGADVVLVDGDDFDPEESGTPFVLLTGHSATPSAAGAVLPQSATRTQIIAAIHAVAAGLLVQHPDLQRREPPIQPAQALTEREIQVLGMLSQGLANKTIAWKLGISEHTVKFHVSSIFTKLNVSSRTEAVTLGARLGLVLL